MEFSEFNYNLEAMGQSQILNSNLQNHLPYQQFYPMSQQTQQISMHPLQSSNIQSDRFSDGPLYQQCATSPFPTYSSSSGVIQAEEEEEALEIEEQLESSKQQQPLHEASQSSHNLESQSGSQPLINSTTQSNKTGMIPSNQKKKHFKVCTSTSREKQQSSQSMGSSNSLSQSSPRSSSGQGTTALQPFTVQRMVQIMNLQEPSGFSGDANNFILYGEIFCYLKAFSFYGRLNSKQSPSSCYLSDFRPVISTSVRANSMIFAELDPQDSVGTRYQNQAAILVAQSSMRKIDEIIAKLRSLSDQTAYTFTKYLDDYRGFITGYAEKVQDVHATFNYDLHAVQERLAENYAKSQIKIMELLDNIEKATTTTTTSNTPSTNTTDSTATTNTNQQQQQQSQEQQQETTTSPQQQSQQCPSSSSSATSQSSSSFPVILQFFVKRLDAQTLTNKTCLTGGNSAFMELISGTRDSNVIQYYFSKFGTPEVLDWKGIVEITLAQFSGNRHFDFDLQTIDGYQIPAKATYSCVSLSPIELVPGFVVSDVLELYVYEINPEILKCLKAKRMLTIAHNRREDISYTIKSEIFLQRFYPELQLHQQHQSHNSHANRKPKRKQADTLNNNNNTSAATASTTGSRNQNTNNNNIANSEEEPYQHQFHVFPNMDSQMQQEEIQSDIFRINRQSNPKYSNLQ